MEIEMKTYEQVVNRAARYGLATYYGGSSEHAGVHAFGQAVVFIYDVSPAKFSDDVIKLMDEAREHRYSDEAIEWLEEKANVLEAARVWQGSADRQGGSFDDWEKMDRGWN
jgi:hypothetical protein